MTSVSPRPKGEAEVQAAGTRERLLRAAAEVIQEGGWSVASVAVIAERAGPMGFARLDPGKPTIAAINGYCFAGGFEFAAWCDFRIGAANAEFGCLSRRWGVPYCDGGTQRFARIMGTGNALYLLMTGARIDARRAYELGFLQEVVPQGEALSRALELAAAIASYPNFPGICADRRAVLAGLSLDLDEGLLLEARTSRAAAFGEEMAAGLQRFAAGARDASPRPPSV